ncbi:MAG: hypothetical protein KC729_21675, partial [Candidatus Eisenbacteria bacterium]|nr:hypothetical protein [Candidatus Eisenbacteria bacterium]
GLSQLGSALVVLAAGLFFAGCASHSQDLLQVRQSLLAGNVDQALNEFEKSKGKDDDLLYLLEKGLMLHLAGDWTGSNEAFEAAEVRHEELYSRSVTREAAALLTSDLALPYRALPYEIEMVAYYRALNYLELGEPDEALVEARKANHLLSLRDPEKSSEDRFRETAFLQYFTGLLYEAAGEANDAIVSMRDAYQGYRDGGCCGFPAPRWLAPDYYAVAENVGLGNETAELEQDHPGVAQEARAGDENNLVVFFESGFAPYREPVDIVLPILDRKDGDAWGLAGSYVDEYGGHVYAYTDDAKLDHVLRFAFPRLESMPSAVVACELELPNGQRIPASPALDLGAVAEADFDARIPGMLLKTVARAITKEIARKQAKKENEVLGWVVNAVNVATENADTRSWILLPQRIDMVKAKVPAGTQQVKARFLDRAGGTVDEWTLDLDARPGETRVLSVRSFP